jgi:hypothetical protein
MKKIIKKKQQQKYRPAKQRQLPPKNNPKQTKTTNK